MTFPGILISFSSKSYFSYNCSFHVLWRWLFRIEVWFVNVVAHLCQLALNHLLSDTDEFAIERLESFSFLAM